MRTVLFLCGLLITISACSSGDSADEPTLKSSAGSSQQVTSVPKNGGRPFTQEEKADIAYLQKHAKPSAPYQLDMTHPQQYRHVINTFKRSGITADTHPHLMSLLAKANKMKTDEPSHPVLAVNETLGTPQTLNYINSMNLTASSPNTFDANGLSSANGGTDTSTVVMELYLTETGHVYATNQDSQHAAGVNFNVPVNGAVPTGTTNSTTKAQATFAYVPKGSAPGTPPIVSYFYSEDSVDPTTACMTKPNYCVRDNANNCVVGEYETSCTNTNPNNATAIKVCYSRGGQGECDYYNQTPNHPTNFIFPLEGSATFANEVVSPPVGIVTITLQNPSQGGGCYLVFQEAQPLDSTIWTVSDQTLNWNYAAASFPDPNSCLEYYNSTTTLLNVSVDGVALQGSGSGAPPIGGFRFTSDRNQIGQDGIYIVPPIEIQQGCFAEGADILMADGSLKKVEDFTADKTELVRGAEGSVLTVLGTSKGIESKPMVRIKTDGGHELLVTETHAIVLIDGAKVAMDVVVGDKINVQKGTANVSHVSREDYDGKVYHLILSERKASLAASGTLYANGILTGDLRMQEALIAAEYEKLSSDPDHVYKRLPKEWHEDYRLHLERKK
ncbi:Hint domain-containing protein [Pseudomonas sp. HK3]